VLVVLAGSCPDDLVEQSTQIRDVGIGHGTPLPVARMTGAYSSRQVSSLVKGRRPLARSVVRGAANRSRATRRAVTTSLTPARSRPRLPQSGGAASRAGVRPVGDYGGIDGGALAGPRRAIGVSRFTPYDSI